MIFYFVRNRGVMLIFFLKTSILTSRRPSLIMPVAVVCSGDLSTSEEYQYAEEEPIIAT